MGYGIASDPLVRAAVMTGVGAIAVSLSMLVVVVALRAGLIQRRAREARFRRVWQPLFVQCIDAVPARLPPLARRDHEPFLTMWNHYRESLRGEATQRLNQLAIAAGMHEAAYAMFQSRSTRGRLIAIVTLGNLRDRRMLADLLLLAEDASPVLSLTAAHALLRIEPAATLTWLLRTFARRADWPVARLASMLSEVGATRVSQPLAAAIRAESASDRAAERLPRLLKLARVAQAESMAATLRRVLDASRDDEVTSACLAELADPRDTALARRHAAHATWFVRVAAAKALGRLGGPEDRGLLTGMLGDANWWVRYRAGQALASLPSVGIGELRSIRGALRDRAAADMLDQVIAERA